MDTRITFLENNIKLHTTYKEEARANILEGKYVGCYILHFERATKRIALWEQEVKDLKKALDK